MSIPHLPPPFPPGQGLVVAAPSAKGHDSSWVTLLGSGGTKGSPPTATTPSTAPAPRAPSTLPTPLFYNSPLTTPLVNLRAPPPRFLLGPCQTHPCEHPTES